MRRELSPRQRQVIVYAARGLQEKETARALGISPSAVNAHMALALLKLGARTVAQAVHRAHMYGYVTHDEIESPDVPTPFAPTPDRDGVRLAG